MIGIYSAPLELPFVNSSVKVQGDSKLLLGFPWPIIFKLEIKNKVAYGI
jgi:hypothetical protein